MHEESLQCDWSIWSPSPYLLEIKALTIDCFYFSDQEVKMEEAMSHTGIHPFLFLFSGFFFFNTCMGRICLIPTNTSIHGVLALNLWLHAGDTLTNHKRWCVFFLIKAASFVVTSVHTSLHFYLLCDVSLQRFKRVLFSHDFTPFAWESICYNIGSWTITIAWLPKKSCREGWICASNWEPSEHQVHVNDNAWYCIISPSPPCLTFYMKS